MSRVEIATLILSIIGALAWTPVIFSATKNYFRRVQVNLFEFEVLKNGFGRSAGDCKVKEGTIILLVLNFFIKNVDYYPARVTANVKLKNGNTYDAELLDFSPINRVNDDGTVSGYRIPIELEFNVSRTIKKNTDNIKCMALLIEGISVVELSDIDAIVLELYSGKCNKKTVKINNSNFPTFNATRIIGKYENSNQAIEDAELAEYISKMESAI